MSIISAEHLTKIYKYHKKDPGLKGSIAALFHRDYLANRAVDDVSFTIESGELVGFLGPNGAGKTTLLKMLSGLLVPTSGQASALGYTPSKRQASYQKQFALVMGQKGQLWWDLPASETFALNKEIYDVADDDYAKTLAELIDLLQVNDDVLRKPVRKLSLGERMKCELIAALIHRPQILYLDEPTIGLDVTSQKAVRDFIRSYNREYKTTIILTSHYMDDIKELCDRVMIIDLGKIIYDGSLAAIVSKFAPSKLITMTFREPVALSHLEQFGLIVDFTEQRATIQIDRAECTTVAGKLLGALPVEDLLIEEQKIDSIIRDIFAHGIPAEDWQTREERAQQRAALTDDREDV